MGKIKNYIKLLRVKHCIKNFLIFLPLVFNGSLFNIEKLENSIVGFISFTFVASSVYVINDIEDRNLDRLHPKKRNRPIASGKVSIKEAIGLLGITLAIPIALSTLVLDNLCSLVLLSLYFMINVLYSKWLKNVPIIDILILSIGFVIRVIYGGVITNIYISGWLYLTVIAASFYMGMGKRRNELKKKTNVNGEKLTRSVLKYYNYAFLDKNMYMCLGLAEAFYALWAMDTKNDFMLWTVPLVMILGMKYSIDIEMDSDGDPVEVIIADKWLWFIAILYAVIIFIAVYI